MSRTFCLDQIQRDVFGDRRQERRAAANGDRIAEHAELVDEAKVDWQQPENALGAVREHLARDGAVYIFWDARHSAPERVRDLWNELADRLGEDGFCVHKGLVADLRPAPAVCAIGRPQGG